MDESGNFGDVDDPARYCIVTLVLHDQTKNIVRYIQELDRANEDLGLDTKVFQFHTAPLIRQDGVFAAMSRKQRGRILDRMMTFVRNVDFRYCCFSVDTDYVNTAEQIVERLERSMSDFIVVHKDVFESLDYIKVYYDAGQKAVSKLLLDVFRGSVSCPVEFAQGARQDDYKLFQVADLICTLRLIALRLDAGQGMNQAERRFFGGPRDFRRNILKKIREKELR